MDLSPAAWCLFSLAGLGLPLLAFESYCLWRLRRREAKSPGRFPSFSVLKPLCGLDDELEENLESHLHIDYPGEYEVLLGVRSASDLAFPVARRFADKYPDRVRLVLQEGEPGHNPKVNQLITLTRHARHEIIAITDSNVRVPPSYLREHAGVLDDSRVGLSSHPFAGVGEKSLGSILDNLTLASFCAPNMATASVALKADEIVGKSIALRREVLTEIGGWPALKDVLAEDQRLGVALRTLGLKTGLCPTPVLNVQFSQPVAHFWNRHTRWSMMRFRVLLPWVLLEPLLNPFVFALAGAVVAYRSPGAWAVAAGVGLASMAFTQACAVMIRGYGFRAAHLALVPLRDVLFFFAWLRGSMMRYVTWRGNRVLVLAKTRLAQPEALARTRNIQRISR